MKEIRRSEVFGHRERGLYQQQDAEEFCAYLLNAISAVLPTHSRSRTSNLVDDLFQIGFRCTWDPPLFPDVQVCMCGVGRVLRDGGARREAVLQHSRRCERGGEGELPVAGGRVERG